VLVRAYGGNHLQFFVGSRPAREKESRIPTQDKESTMIEPITREEYERELRKLVARARRISPPRLERVAPPIDAARLKALCTGPITRASRKTSSECAAGRSPWGRANDFRSQRTECGRIACPGTA